MTRFSRSTSLASAALLAGLVFLPSASLAVDIVWNTMQPELLQTTPFDSMTLAPRLDTELSGNSVTVNAPLKSGKDIYDASGASFVQDMEASIVSPALASNRVTITPKGLAQHVYGAYSFVYSRQGKATSGNISDNTIDIQGSTSMAVYGGHSYARSISESLSGNVIQNHVTVSGKVNGPVYGGFTAADGLGAISGNANQNVVTINGLVKGNIYGGYSRAQGDTLARTGDAINNTVILNPNANVQNAALFGGFTESSGEAGNAFTQNTLEIHAKTIAKNISGFQNIHIFLPSNFKKTDTFLTLTGNEKTPFFDRHSNASTLLISGLENITWRNNDSVCLIRNEAGLQAGNMNLPSGFFNQGGQTFNYQVTPQEATLKDFTQGTLCLNLVVTAAQ